MKSLHRIRIGTPLDTSNQRITQKGTLGLKLPHLPWAIHKSDDGTQDAHHEHMIFLGTMFDDLDIDLAVGLASFEDFILRKSSQRYRRTVFGHLRYLAATPYYFPQNYGVCEANDE
jgi:hypothetical protein